MTTQKARPPIARIAELQTLIATFAQVLRVPQLADSGRSENDVDHSFGLALTCWFLAPKIAPELDMTKILYYALAHDIVEVYAGDTFVFGDPAAIASKATRENAAIAQLRADWPDFPELTDYAEGYAQKHDEEAKFVYSVDKILPVLMVNLGEKADFWNRHNITLEMQKREKEKTIKVSDKVAPYYEELVTWITQENYFYNPDDAS